MGDGIRGQFGNDQRGGLPPLAVPGPAPVGELLFGEQAGEAGAPGGGAELLAEVSPECCDFGGGRGDIR